MEGNTTDQEKDVTKEVKRELLETQKLVRSFLIDDERNRNSDKRLEWLVFLYDTGLSPEDLPFDLFSLARPFETVRRTRAKLQSENPGLYGPTDPEVIRKRQRAEVAYRQFCSPRFKGV